MVIFVTKCDEGVTPVTVTGHTVIEGSRTDSIITACWSCREHINFRVG